MPSATLTFLETPFDGLDATPASLPFDPSVDVRAFLLERPDGNLLVYNIPGLKAAKSLPIESTFSERHMIGDNFEVIPIPELQFGVLVPWGGTADQPYLAGVTRDQTHDAIDEVIERIRRGESR